MRASINAGAPALSDEDAKKVADQIVSQVRPHGKRNKKRGR